MSPVFQYYDDDDSDDPTLVDSSGNEYWYCTMCDVFIPLPDILCGKCNEIEVKKGVKLRADCS